MRSGWQELVAVALGGALGSLARWSLGQVMPYAAGSGWPWATLVANLSGSFLIGVLMVLVSAGVVRHRLARPFLGVGLLGGWTTFSTVMVETVTLGAWAYLVVSVLGGLAAVWAGARLTRALVVRA